MAKAYFNKAAGKFEIKFKDGHHFTWTGSLWISDDGKTSWKSRRFYNWYNRKGKYIQVSWEKIATGNKSQTNADAGRFQVETKDTQSNRLIKSSGNLKNTILGIASAILSAFFLIVIIGLIMWGIYYFFTHIAAISSSLNLNVAVINSTWAGQFFNNVSTARGTPYNYCPTLSQYAEIRFNTMSSGNNYTISHYGQAADFQKYFGIVYNVAFDEEVLYPSGFTPSGYISDLMNDAALHWQGLADQSYLYYGYYIHNGPSYDVYGPNGGYSRCLVTEIPGPNINISQFFAQHGCSAVVKNITWFVIETASACPK